jgi:hypothetical protein
VSWKTDRPCPPANHLFWAKVERTDGCWNWTAYKSAGGYGRFAVRSIAYQAHRVAYEDAFGRIPPGLVLDHICRNKGCVRPDHLQVVTQTTNILRGEAWSAVNARKTACPNGHPYDESNTYVIPSTGGRMCRICRSAARAGERARRRAIGATGQEPGRSGNGRTGQILE